MEAPTMPTQDVESHAETTSAPQAPETPAQAGSQVQETSSTQVERSESTQPSQEDARRASDFETARHLKQLAKEFRSFKSAFEKSQTSQAPQATPQAPTLPTNEELLRDPVSAFRRIAQAELQGLRQEIPQQFQQFVETNKYETARQEALRLIKTNDLVKSDPQGQEKMAEILNEEDEYGNSLEKYSYQNPRHAAQIALMTFQNRFGIKQRTAAAPTKAQMQTTATAVQASSPQSNLEQEAAQLYRMALNDPTLMTNPDYKAKMDDFNKRLRLEQASKGL